MKPTQRDCQLCQFTVQIVWLNSRYELLKGRTLTAKVKRTIVELQGRAASLQREVARYMEGA
jgi:hypothetical protein